jgi:adenine specific DNA methylase Mod
VDCFAGSCTTLAVGRKLGRKAIDIERRESQCEEILPRKPSGIARKICNHV